MSEYVSKKFGKLLHIYLSVWTRNIYYIDTDNKKLFVKILNEQLDQNFREDDFRFKDGNFSVFTRKGIPVGVIRCPKKNIPELAHECLHATFWILEDVGVELCEKSEETFCYTQMMLLTEILKTRRNK